MNTELRDYQLEMLSRLNKAWKRNRSVMVQMPTGTGKTHLMAEVIRSPLLLPQGGGPVLVVAHRHELIEQISRTLDSFGVEHGLIVSGRETDFSKRVQVASVQTLARRSYPQKPTPIPSRGEGDFYPSLVVVDEAHHAQARTYRMLWERWPKARFLGLTATPCRMSGEPFTDLFDVLLQSWSIQEFIDRGWLSDFEYISAAPNSAELMRVRALQKRGADGDYQTKELVTVMDVPESIEHLYKTYRQFAFGKKGIVYAIDRQHARHIAEYYQAHGVHCAVIDAKTPAGERERLIKGLSPGPSFLPCKPAELERPTYGRLPVAFLKERGAYSTLDVLVNVDIFSEGFDCPEVEFIQLARPTLSLSKYLQQVGRGMRISEGKPHVLILDNVGLYQTFGLPTEERDWRATFYGQAKGKGLADSSRMVVLDEDWQSTTTLQDSDERRKELVNLQMVRIKKGGKRGAGLEIFLQDGRYGVRNNGRVSCPARFKEIVRLKDQSGYFAAGIYGGKLCQQYVEYATLIDRKGIDLNLKLFRDISWRGDYFYSSYKPKNYQPGDYLYHVCWDPKGNCYYEDDPAFKTMAGVEVAYASEHFDREAPCRKFRYTTGNVSPRFHVDDLFFNKHIIIARDYLVVKQDKNHAYRICGYLGDTVIVQNDDLSGYQQFYTDGKKGTSFRSLPKDMEHVASVSCLYYKKNLRLQSP